MDIMFKMMKGTDDTLTGKKGETDGGIEIIK